MSKVNAVLEIMSTGVEWFSVVVLMVGFIKGLYAFIISELSMPGHRASFEKISSLRPLLGNYILLGLDFYIVSDIISSMLHAEMNELISLGIIVALRTAIGFFLGKELQEFNLKSEMKS
ncbi:MAG: DUF1622 domain-containing protein [Saprospiraceae bacterium]